MLQRRFLLCLVVLGCFFFKEIENRRYRHSYINHNSNANEEGSVFHLSNSYPRHRMRKQMIPTDGHSERPSKRGFLANLATLLNDAESLSRKNFAPSNVSMVDSATTAIASTAGASAEKLRQSAADDDKKQQQQRAAARSLKPERSESKNEPTPSAGAVESSLKTEGKDAAPIFALFHGKIVPLGKLPDTSFKKSRTEVANGKETAEEHRSPSHSESSETKSVINQSQENSEQQTADKKDKSKPLSQSQLNRLSAYLHNLESKNQQQKAELETRMIKRPATKDVTATAKDEVPDILPDLKNPEFIKHVKGIVLDDGKMVPLSEHHKVEESEKNEDATTKSSEATEPAETKDNEKSYAIDNNVLSQLTRSKEETNDPIARDTQSVSLSIDTLKGLLKKKDNGISLAKLLNKQPEEASVATQDEDPGTIEDFAAGGLKKTNDYRAAHHSPPLVWSDDLATEAQKMAEHLADMKSLEISSDLDKRGYGENVAKVWANFKTAGDAATTMWYKQSSNYRYEDPRLDQNTGQFAQVVWKDSKELGMGVAKSIDDINNKYVYVVALYRPPGNIETTLRENVLKTGNDTSDVYATFFKRSHGLRHGAGVLLPKHSAYNNKN